MNQPNDELDPQLKSALEGLKRISPRNPQAVARGRARFLAQAAALSSEMSAQADARSARAWPVFLTRVSFAGGIALVLVLVLLLGGTGVTVYASQESLPDAPLYPVKLLSEDAQIAVTFPAEKKLNLQLKFADRRMNEIDALNARRTAPPDGVADRLQQELNAALGLAIDMPTDGQSKALTRIQTTIKRQQQTLSRVANSAPDRAKPVLVRVESALVDHLELVEMGLADPPGLRKKIDGTKNSVPPGQEKRGTTVPPGQTPRPPGQKQDSPKVVPPGQRQRPATVVPDQELRVTPTPTAPGRPPFRPRLPINPGKWRFDGDWSKP